MRQVSTLLFVVVAASVGQTAEMKIVLNGDNTKATFIGAKPEGKHEGGFKSGQSHLNACILFPEGLILTRAARKILPGVDGKTCFTEENHVQDHFVPCVGHVSIGTLC